MKELIPKSLLERALKYAPVLQMLEARGARIIEQERAMLRNARRIEFRRAEEEELRLAASNRKRKEALVVLKTRQQKSIPAVSMIRRLQLEQESKLVQAVTGYEWEEESELPEEGTQEVSGKGGKTKFSKKEKKSLSVDQPFPVKPDPFTTAAPAYRENSASRLVCRKCDHTLCRGARGVHLFSWNENYHIALNDEIVDTISFKEIVDPNELQKSLWKRAKVACPCCGTSVGTLGVTHARMKVMFKGVCVAWRSTHDVASKVGRPALPNKGALVPTQVHSARPVGSSLPSTWLLSNAGLMTHTRRWVLDSSVLNRVVEQAEHSSKSSTVPPISDAEPSPGCVVRASDKEPPALTPSMKRLALRAMAVENLAVLDVKKSLRPLMDMLEYFQTLIMEDDAAAKPAAIKEGIEVAFSAQDETVTAEDPREEAYELDRNSSLAFLRFACLDRLAQIRADAANKANVDGLLKTPRGSALLEQCGSYLMRGGTPVSFVSARTLCSGARLLSSDKTALEALINVLAERKAGYGPAAAAFGRSAEYLKSTLASSKGFTEGEIDAALEKATSMHPSPGARFGVEFEPSGFVELFCTHGHGSECTRRATHAPPPPLIGGVPPNVRDPKLRIPTMCRIHAPIGYVATAEGYRGVIPPYEDPLRGKPGHLQVVASGYQHSGSERPFVKGGWYGRRNNRIVEVPDPDDTTFGPPEPGTLYIGSAWEQNVKVCYTTDDLKEALEYFEKHIARAEELAKSNNGIPSVSTAVGLDVEWKPEFVYNEDNNVCSVIQIATRERAFIFDAIALGTDLDPLMRRLFRAREVIKIGHGLGEDLARVAQALSRAVGKQNHIREYFPVESVMELAPLFAKAESKVFAYGTMPSLVAMVEAATGMRLDKRCQMTNWERRPLSPAQIRYAATDAACGLILFDHFFKKIQELSGQSEQDIRPFLQNDVGTTVPQRAGMLYSPSSGAPTSGPSLSPITVSQMVPPQPFMFPTQPQQYQYSPAPSPYHHSPYGHHVHHHAYSVPHRMGLLGRSGTATRLSAVPRTSNRKILSKQEMKRLRELQNDLISQGVKVDEHAKLEGLEVASEHLQKSLSKVVRDSLMDPPPTAMSTVTPHVPSSGRQS